MIVYMVTDGSYSDYRVCGVYSTKELAKKAVVAFQAENDIDELELDHFPPAPRGMHLWFVSMENDGNTTYCERTSNDAGETTFMYFPGNCGGNFTVWACDKEHAVKIVNEKRTQMIALGTWSIPGTK